MNPSNSCMDEPDYCGNPDPITFMVQMFSGFAIAFIAIGIMTTVEDLTVCPWKFIFRRR